MKIREYMLSDCALMAKLFYDTVHTINTMDYTDKQIHTWATGNVDLDAWHRRFLEHDTLIAETDGQITGFANMSKAGYIDMLYVHKDFQRRGIATALLNELERCALSNGISRFETYASITARPFFEKHGYSVERKNTVIQNGVELVNYKMTNHITF